MMSKYKISIVACARWEQDDIIEWVAYHKEIGIDHIFLYSNDDDPSVLRRIVSPYMFGAEPFLTYFHWPHTGEQVKMYLHFLRNFLTTTEWLIFLDIDEFITLKKQNNIKDFLRIYENTFDCVYLNWLVFGNCGRIKRDRTLDTLNAYTRRSAAVNLHTKNIVRTEVIQVDRVLPLFNLGALGFWHFWDKYNFNMRICDVMENPITNYADDFPSNALNYSRSPGYSENCLETAYISHFQFKSEEDFIRRSDRGGFVEAAETWRRDFESGAYKLRLGESNRISDTYLAKFWHSRLLTTKQVMVFGGDHPSHVNNIAFLKPTEQSSVYQPLTGEAELSYVRDHGNDGCRRGTPGFHTAFEDSPWWMVDLLATYEIITIHIYNRIDNRQCSERLRGCQILASTDKLNWEVVFLVDTDSYLGDDSGIPLIIKANQINCQYVKIMSPKPGFLHLDEVEIYGSVVSTTEDM